MSCPVYRKMVKYGYDSKITLLRQNKKRNQIPTVRKVEIIKHPRPSFHTFYNKINNVYFPFNLYKVANFMKIVAWFQKRIFLAM